MPVQDDERERELVRMFNLDWDAAHQRSGVDALLDIEVQSRPHRLQIEVKSTTGHTVSTARDVGMEHIRKWREKLFVIGFYSKDARRPELLRCLCLTPVDMEPWITDIEAKIQIDFKLAQCASRRLTLQDLFEVCGEQQQYTIQDAKKLHKLQWTSQQYTSAADITDNGNIGLSQQKMLEVLQLRAQYIAERGATLNNPHITKTHLIKFMGTDRDISAPNWASSVREIAREFCAQYPNHPAVLASRISPP